MTLYWLIHIGWTLGPLPADSRPPCASEHRRNSSHNCRWLIFVPSCTGEPTQEGTAHLV